MKVLRRLPRLEAPLRDGRLCLSTVALLGPILTEDNLEQLVERAAFKTKAEVEHLVASVQPRSAPRDGIRKLAAGGEQAAALTQTAATTADRQVLTPAPAPTPSKPPTTGDPVDAGRAAWELSTPEPKLASQLDSEAPPDLRRERRPELRPVSEDHFSLRVTLDAAARADLEALRNLLSHKIPDGDLAAVVREAIRCALEKHGKRKGAVAPARNRTATPVAAEVVELDDGSTRSGSALRSRYVPAKVRRIVWARDGGRCTFVGPDGHRCESRWQLELDHVTPFALGGQATADDLRLRCKPHNIHYAERCYGRVHMDRFRKAQR
jgi:hypothetical protein